MQSVAVNIHIQCLPFQKTLLPAKKINRVVSSYPDHDRVAIAETFTILLLKLRERSSTNSWCIIAYFQHANQFFVVVVFEETR